MVIKRGLYYSYIIISQPYSAARLNDSNSFNKLDAVVKLVDAIIGVGYYIGGNASYITNYCQ